MSLPTLLLLEGFLYIVLFGGLSFLRREGLSGQFAIEAATLTVITSGLAALSGFSIHPILFLIIIYLITMRVRLLVDVGNVFARRRQFTYADRIYTIAARLWPDNSNQLIVLINRGTLRLHQGELDEGLASFAVAPCVPRASRVESCGVLLQRDQRRSPRISPAMRPASCSF